MAKSLPRKVKVGFSFALGSQSFRYRFFWHRKIFFRKWPKRQSSENRPGARGRMHKIYCALVAVFNILFLVTINIIYNICRVDIWRDQWDRRSRKFFVSCVNFLKNNAKCYIISTPNYLINVPSLPILRKFVCFFTQNMW